MYLHGRNGTDSLETGFVIMCSENMDVAEMYAGSNGSVWSISANNSTNTLDLNTDEQKVIDELKSDLDNGYLHSEIESCLLATEIDWSEFTVNPSNLVNSAEWFDLPEFCEWLNDRFSPDMVITNDGAIVFNINGVSTERIA